MNLRRRSYLLKRYYNRFKYLFFSLYKRDFLRTNYKDIRESILIASIMIGFSSLFQVFLIDSSIVEESIRNKIISIRLSFIILPALLYIFLTRRKVIIKEHLGNYLSALIVIILFLHYPMMVLNPSNQSAYLMGSGIILLGSSVILWMEPVRIFYISTAYTLILLPLSFRIASTASNTTFLEVEQNTLNCSLIVFIGFLANTMINYWRFEDYRTNKRLKRTLKNLKETNEKIRIISHQDSLTSLYNRRYLLEQFKLRVQESIAEDYDFGLVILDLDYLKKINDQFGHIQGDRVILEFAEVLTRLTNPKDIIARIGGDEFCLLTHKITEAKLLELMEKIRDQFSSLKVPVYDNPTVQHDVSASIGAVLVNKNQPKKFDILYHSIDEALYQAKTDGRNKAILI